MIKTESNTRDSYKLYKTLTKKPQDIKIYILIANAYMKFIIQHIVEGYEVSLPARLGNLSIIGSKKKIKFDEKGLPLLPPNWARTKKLWENNPQARLERRLVYCTNEESNGVIYKYLWSKNRVPIENKTLYALRMTRLNKRTVSDAIKSGKEYFIKSQ